MPELFFLVFAIIIIFLSSKLSRYASFLEENSKLGSLFLGGIILAGITSLPELVTTLSSLYVNDVNLAIGDILGSNMFNIFLFAYADLYFLPKLFVNKINKRYGLIVLLLLIINYFLIINFEIKQITAISFVTIITIVLYMLYLFLIKKIDSEEIILKSKTKLIRHLKVKFVIMAILMIIASVFLTFFAKEIMLKYPQFSGSLVGAFLLGIATSLPELTSIFTLIKIRKYNLAISNVIGSNMFNFIILAFADIIYPFYSIYNFKDFDSVSLAKGCFVITLFFIFRIYLLEKVGKFLYILSLFLIMVSYLVFTSLQLFK